MDILTNHNIEKESYMDSKIINSAIILSEQDSCICKETNASKYMNLGLDRYILAISPDVRKVADRVGIEQSAAASLFTRFYIAHFWRFAKAIYDFSPLFLSVLEQTEDAPVYAEVLKRMPYRDFVMPLPSGMKYDGMFVHVEFDESRGKNDTDTLFFLCLFKSASKKEDITVKMKMQWYCSGEMFLKTYRDTTSAMEEAMKNGKGTVGNITIHGNPKPHGKAIDCVGENGNDEINRCLRIAISACYYLASKNAEIKEMQIPKSKRPVVNFANGKKPKRVAIKAYQVGYVFGKSFEEQIKARTSSSGQTTGPTGGLTVRPHVRRAHWHHYWVGEGRTVLEVRWIKPTLVLPEGKKEVELATVRRVNPVSLSKDEDRIL